MKKNPWIAALLNFVFLGAGYVYLKKRKMLGLGLIAVVIVMTVEFFLGTIGHVQNLINTHSYSLTLLSIVLAYDAYGLAKGKEH